MKKRTLDEVYRRWRDANPRPTLSTSRAGWRLCLGKGCMVWIEAGQERVFCYGHGGKPNAYRRPRSGEMWRQHLEDLRRSRAKAREGTKRSK